MGDDLLLLLLQDNNLSQTGSSGASVVPVADFTGTPLSGDQPLSVTFTDTSSNAPTSWLWEKNSGSGWVSFAGTPTVQNPVESFAAGTWSVRLTVSNAAAGSNTKTRTNYIVSAVPPTVVSITVAANGTDVTIVFSEVVTGQTVHGFELSGDNSLTYVSGEGTSTSHQITDFTVGVGQVLTALYGGFPTIKDLSGNPLADFSGAAVVNNSTQDVTAPTVSSATVAANGTDVTIVFSEVVTGSTGFTFSTPTATLTYSSGSGTNTLVFTVPTIFDTDTPTLNYTAGNIVDGGGNPLATISGGAVTNNSTQVAGDPLDLKLAALEAAGKLVCAWFLPLVTPAQYLTLNGANVEGWAAAYGTQKVDLVELTNRPQWDATLFGNKGGVVFDGTDDRLTGTGNVINWPNSTADFYMLAAVRNDGTGIIRTPFGYGTVNTTSRMLQFNGNTVGRIFMGAAVVVSATTDTSGARTIGGVIDIGGTSAVYIDGASAATGSTASAALTLTEVRLGCRPGAALFFQGPISCAAILNSTATLTDFTDLEALMRARLS